MSPVVVWPEEETERVEVKWHYYSEENCLTAEKQPVEAVEKLKQEAEPALLPSKNSDKLQIYHRQASGSINKTSNSQTLVGEMIGITFKPKNAEF